MNLKYRIAAWLLGYPPIKDPDYSEAYRMIRRPSSWLLIRSPGSTLSTAAWIKIGTVKLEMPDQVDLDAFHSGKTYQPSKRHGTFSGTIG